MYKVVLTFLDHIRNDCGCSIKIITELTLNMLNNINIVFLNLLYLYLISKRQHKQSLNDSESANY